MAKKLERKARRIEKERGKGEENREAKKTLSRSILKSRNSFLLIMEMLNVGQTLTSGAPEFFSAE